MVEIQSPMFSKGGAPHNEMSPEKAQKRREENAHEYTSFLMSTFAKVMLETSKREDITIEEEIMGNAFLGDIMGEALVDSGPGESLRQDLLSSMLENQDQTKKVFPQDASSAYVKSGGYDASS